MADMATPLRLNGRDYVILTADEYQKLTGASPVGVDAGTYTRESLGRDLRAAREKAGLSQDQLAKKVRKSQTMISGAESGKIRVSDRYIGDIYKACGVPKTWKASDRNGG